MTTAIEPSADEIERVAEVIAQKVPTLTLWIARIIARAAILAMDRRAEVVGEPVAHQWRSRIKGGAWDAWENGRYGQTPPPFMEIEERPLYASPPAPAVAVPASMVGVVESQVAYWNRRQQAEKSLEDGFDEDGTRTPIGDEAAWSAGYCNGRYSEADWWLKTLTALAAAPEPPSTNNGGDQS
jgi:hypothetical protein